MLLSLIIPFFNSEHNSQRLLKTLEQVKQRDIEFILINDGSIDNTFCLLEEFKASIPDSNVTLINQDNRGPGGARNSGLKVAKGKYVWFVDSDDDITLEAIDVVRDNYNSNYDFIDFNVQSTKELKNHMNLDAGEYFVKDKYRIELLKNFGPISSKAVRRELLIENSIFYPEYCLYEDNPLGFIYPFFIKSFLKTEVIGYLHHLEFESITRSKMSMRSFDRLRTAVYGLEEGLKLAKGSAEISVLEKKFIEKYLLITTEKLVSKTPSKNWIMTWRVMKQYRTEAKRLNIKSSPFEAIKETTYNKKVRSYFAAQWMASFVIVKDQTEYFDVVHKKAWC